MKAGAKAVSPNVATTREPYSVNYHITIPPFRNQLPYWTVDGRNLSIDEMMKKRFSDTVNLGKYLKEHPEFYLSFFFAIDASGNIYNVHPDMHNPIRSYDETFLAIIKSLSPCRLRNVDGSSMDLSFSKDFFEVQVAFSTPQKERAITLTIKPAEQNETFNRIAQGLTLGLFGTYNCDRILNLPTMVVIDAVYIDERTNKEIPGGTTLYVVDAKNNLAYYSSPDQFSCDVKADVALLLATKDRIFISQEHFFSITNIHRSGTYKFDMKDITGKVNSGPQLAQYLHISSSQLSAL